MAKRRAGNQNKGRRDKHEQRQDRVDPEEHADVDDDPDDGRDDPARTGHQHPLQRDDIPRQTGEQVTVRPTAQLERAQPQDVGEDRPTQTEHELLHRPGADDPLPELDGSAGEVDPDEQPDDQRQRAEVAGDQDVINEPGEQPDLGSSAEG